MCQDAFIESFQGIWGTISCAESTHEKALESTPLRHYDVITKTLEAMFDFLQQ
jgi:hypothetical protein